MKFSAWLRLPELESLEILESEEKTRLFGSVIRKKYFLRQLYVDWYREFKRSIDDLPDGVVIELGSGAGFLKAVMPRAVTSDILDVADMDIQFSAMRMPFQDNSVKAFCMLDILHHVADNVVLFAEAQRCLIPGGRMVMIEPANTWWARFVWCYLHEEPFDPCTSLWGTQGSDPLMSANSAIPWIIFFRDRKEFLRRYPSLHIKEITVHTPLRYLISGGVSKRQFFPSAAYPIIKGMETLLSPFNKFIGMFYTIVVEKK